MCSSDLFPSHDTAEEDKKGLEKAFLGENYIIGEEIAKGIGVIAEVDYSRIETRLKQGWVKKVSSNLDEIFQWVDEHRKTKEPISIAYYGNIVDLLEYVDSHNIKAELLSDQTSCHAVYEGGYTPVGLTFEEGRALLASNTEEFRRCVDTSLRRHFQVIKRLCDKGAKFWDYGNSFMASVFDAGEPSIARNGIDTSEGFIFPSYVEDIMGPLALILVMDPIDGCVLVEKIVIYI